MALKLKHRIAVKQARSVLLISLILGLVFTSWQIYLDLVQEKRQLITSVDRMLAQHKEIASWAVYNLNKSQANSVTQTLISHPEIYSATIIDDFNEELSAHSRLPIQQSVPTEIGSYFFQIAPKIENSLKIDATQNTEAKLIIQLDTAYIAGSFVSRAATSLLLGIIHNILLACIFLLFFYRYLSKPIVNILGWVNQLRLGNDQVKLPYTQPDEIGDLVSDFADLWQERQQMTDQLNETIESLSKSESFSRSLMENAGDAMFLCLPDTTIVRANNRAADNLERDKEDILGQKISSFSQSFSTLQLVEMFDALTEKQVTTFEDIYLSASNKAFPIEARIIKLTLQSTDYILILARDISVRKESEKQIFELAFFDPLTGLPNRRLFVDRLTSSLQLHHSNESFGAMLYLDLDRFKTINDSLGHGIGDTLLCKIAQRLTHLLPEKSTCSRFGGDEFVVLLPEMGRCSDMSAEAVMLIAQQILDQMSIPFEINSHTLYCTTSIGIAMFPDQNNQAMDILRSADTALYRAKALGRNGFQFFDPEMQSSAQERLEIEKGIYLALENKELELWFQPQIGDTNEIIGAEALLRWQHPTRGMISPVDFIQIAEDTGQIIEVGTWVLNSGLKQLSLWRERGLPSSFRRLALNISPIQFMQVNFVEQLLKLMQKHHIPGDMVELEITENMLLNNFDVACNKMKLLKQKGVSFAIDDFGTGYSSLKYLRDLPLDILKIDRSFVTNLRSSSEEAAIVEVIIATADRLDLIVIAEGVETVEERDVLKELGCHCFQGYLYSKPLPAIPFEKLLHCSIEEPLERL